MDGWMEVTAAVIVVSIIVSIIRLAARLTDSKKDRQPQEAVTNCIKRCPHLEELLFFNLSLTISSRTPVCVCVVVDMQNGRRFSYVLTCIKLAVSLAPMSPVSQIRSLASYSSTRVSVHK